MVCCVALSLLPTIDINCQSSFVSNFCTCVFVHDKNVNVSYCTRSKGV